MNSKSNRKPLTPKQKIDFMLDAFRRALDTYEQLEPQWFRVNLLKIVKDSLYNLRHHSSSRASETFEGSLNILLAYGVDWDWDDEGYGSPLSLTISSNDMDDAGALVEKLMRGVIQHVRLECLSGLTGDVIRVLEADRSWTALAGQTLSFVKGLSKPMQSQTIESLCIPKTLNPQQCSATQRKLIQQGLLAATFFDDPVDLRFDLECGRERFRGSVQADFHPLQVDKTSRKANYPIQISLQFDGAVSAINLTGSENEKFWTGLYAHCDFLIESERKKPGIGLYGLFADGEMGAEIYSAAVTRDQAKIVFSDAEKMVDASPFLQRRVEKTVNNIAILLTNSFFRPISSEARGLDGKRVHFALIDEIHEHPSSHVVDKMRAGTKGRRQALIFEITNSGYDRNSVCWAHHDYSARVLDRVTEDDSWFAYICQLDACAECQREGKSQPQDSCPNCDQWTDESVWIKANPCLDVSITRKYLREQVREAIGMPSKQNIVKRLNFCAWTEQSVRWIDLGAWDDCARPVDRSALHGRRCFGGLDLSSTTDISAFVLAFPPEEAGELWQILCRFWVPEDNVRQRAERDRVPYPDWIRQGLIEATPGNVVDYAFIREQIGKDAKEFEIVEIAFDSWNAGQLSTQLQDDGLTMVPFRQGFGSLSGPTKELEKLIMGRQLAHGGHPVMRWMVSNVAVKQDPAGNVKPDKSKSTERIDGVVATIDAGLY